MSAERPKAALDAALREYESLTAERARLDARIAQLAQDIGTLTRLCGIVPTIPWGLTDACRMALKAAGQPLTAVEIRAQIEAMGFDLSRYSNPMAAIHTTLRRMNDSGEIDFSPRGWGKPTYTWRGLPEASLAATGPGREESRRRDRRRR